ncbi:hypothetical protein AAHE18_02G181000 [Arachis hypogaea]
MVHHLHHIHMTPIPPSNPCNKMTDISGMGRVSADDDEFHHPYRMSHQSSSPYHILKSSMSLERVTVQVKEAPNNSCIHSAPTQSCCGTKTALPNLETWYLCNPR